MQELEDKIDNKEIYFKDDIIDIFLNTFIKVVKPKLKEYFPSLKESYFVEYINKLMETKEYIDDLDEFIEIFISCILKSN